MMADFQAFAQICSARTLNTIFEGMALAGLSRGVLRVAKFASAVSRFAVWSSTLLAVVLMPFVMRSVPGIASHRGSVELSAASALILFSAWAVISVLLLIRLGMSLLHVRRLRSRAEKIDAVMHSELARMVREHGGKRGIELLVSREIRVPTALGFFRPAVVLPAWALEQLSPEELKSVLLHELAHLSRWDDWTNLGQKLIKAIFFFHPAVWFIESRLSLEREMACDDLVLAQTANPAGYAASLVSIAEKAFSEKLRTRALALAQHAIGQVRQTSLRIAQILEPNRAQGRKAWLPAAMAGAFLLTAAFAGTAYAPELVSFQAPRELSATAKLAAASPKNTTAESSFAPSVRAFNASFKVPMQTLTAKPVVVPARARVRHTSKPRLILAKARTPKQPTPMLLLFRTNAVDGSNPAMWTLSVWRITSTVNGVTRVEETIVMNSI